MKKKIIYTISLLTVFSAVVNAQVSEKIDNVYTTYGRPVLISLCVIFIVVGGIANMSDIRAGGEQAKKAALSWGMLVLWPVIIFAVAEIAKQFIG